MTSKQLYQLIRGVPEYLNERPSTPEDAAEKWQMAQAAIQLLGEITPRMLLRVFPVTKTYDGERWECKDYFYTMRALEDHGLDAPMDDHVLEVLWEYMNPHISHFVVWITGAMSDFRVAMGEKDPMVEFLEDQGIPTYRRYTDTSGREVMVNNLTGEVQRIVKPKPKMPRWWRVIEGGLS